MIDLSLLPFPNSVEPLDYETVLTAMRADLLSRAPELATVMGLESEPINKLLEVCAYRETLLRQRENESVLAVTLAYATGADLDNLAALFGVQRLLVSAADPTAVPPVPAVYETDARLRLRVQLALEGFSTAGPRGAYEFHSLSASPQVKSVAVSSPTPVQVLVTLLSTEGDGTADAALQATVLAALNAEDVRPLTDQVLIQSATITPYSVAATLTLYPGPDAEVVRAAAQQATEAYVAEHHRIGHDITLSGLYAALHQPGVQRVVLTSPAADIVCNATQAAWCSAISVTIGGTDA